MIGTQDLQSLPRQLRMLHGPAVAMRPAGVTVFLALPTAVVVNVIQMQHAQVPYGALRHTPLDRSLSHNRKGLELQQLITFHRAASSSSHHGSHTAMMVFGWLASARFCPLENQRLSACIRSSRRSWETS